jgi:putative SOS response-associated peptidase YedK
LWITDVLIMFHTMRRAYHLSLINLSLEILHAVAYDTEGAFLRRDLRLALRVLMAFVEDRKPLEQFWSVATGPRHPWESCAVPLGHIKIELRRSGWHPADGDFPPETPDICAQLGLPGHVDLVAERYGVTDQSLLDRGKVGALIAPGARCWVITQASPKRQLRSMDWGLRLGSHPATARNARRVTVIEDPACRFWSMGSVVAGVHPGTRCLIPVAEIGYREPGSDAGPATSWFAVADEPIFSIAGLMFSDPYHAVAMHVSEANPLLSPFGKLMPLILHREDEYAWLEHGDLERLAAPFPSQLMRKLLGT